MTAVTFSTRAARDRKSARILPQYNSLHHRTWWKFASIAFVARARHHYVMGSQLRTLGRFAEAQARFAAVLQATPLNWRAAAQWLLASVHR
jgi:hypothetical protein